ncbi:MAG: hypothetical protein II954_01575, partial [Synergistaceae bacterium]|nr:hypothetical protein [Synergistaceae bacterium]
DQRAFRGGVWTERNAGFSVVVGKIDDPENQTQYPLVLDFQKDGHQVVYGAPSSGKTTFIQTALISACLSYTPEQVKFIIIDYGYWGNKFAGLPHCIMSADPEEEAKISEAGEYILNELRRRKELFSRVGAANLKEYTEFTGKSMPKILVVVDGMASLNEHNPGLMNPLIQTAREGGSYGVYLLLSAGTAGSFMYRIYQYVKCNYALQMTDKSDYRALVGGNGTVQPSRRAGRGLKRNSLENDPLNPSDPPQPLEFQTALCVRGGTDRERSLNLRELIASMSASWRGRDPLRVRIGLDKKTSEPAEFVLEEMNGCIISGTDGGGKSSVLGVIAKSLNDDKFTRLYIYEVKKFLEPLCPRVVAVHDAEGADRMLAEIAGEFDSRIGETGERIALCIDDFMTFYRGISEESAKILETLTRDGAARGIYVCIVCDAASLAKLHVFKVKAFMNCLTNENAIIAGGSLGDYPAFSGMWRGTDIHMGEHEGVIVHNKRAVEVVFSKAEGRSEHVPKIFAEPHSLRAIAGALKNYASEGLGNLGGISRLVGILSEAEWSEPALKDYVKTFSVSDETRKAYEDFSQDMHKFADFLNQYARSMDEVEGEKPYSAGWYSSLLRYKNNRLLSAIDGLINGLASDWHGEAQKAFTASYRAKREKFARVSEGLSENLRELQDFLRSHADSLHLTEREQALLSEYIHEDDTH